MTVDDRQQKTRGAFFSHLDFTRKWHCFCLNMTMHGLRSLKDCYSSGQERRYMKISGYGNIRPGSGSKKTDKTSSSSSFADILALSETDEKDATVPVSDVAATSALSNLLSLQEISEEDIKRKRLVQQGQNMLDTLEKLRQQLLIGAIPGHMLQDLSRQLSIEKQMTNDPAMNNVIEEIELRLAVELAKLEVAKNHFV
jgi:hypothetical protein